MATKKSPPKDPLLELALSLSAKEVQPLRFDPLDAKRALQKGQKALSKHTRRLKAEFPGFDLDSFAQGPELCDRVRQQQRNVAQRVTATGSIAQILTAVRHRKALMPLAQSLASVGKLPIAEVDKIARGRGQSDQVQDVAELTALLTPLKAVVEATLGAGVLERAAQAAAAALGAQGTIANEDEESADLRDRYATLVARVHERMRTAAAAVTSYNEAVFLVPSLTSPASGSKAEPDAAPEAVAPA